MLHARHRERGYISTEYSGKVFIRNVQENYIDDNLVLLYDSGFNEVSMSFSTRIGRQHTFDDMAGTTFYVLWGPKPCLHRKLDLSPNLSQEVTKRYAESDTSYVSGWPVAHHYRTKTFSEMKVIGAPLFWSDPALGFGVDNLAHTKSPAILAGWMKHQLRCSDYYPEAFDLGTFAAESGEIADPYSRGKEHYEKISRGVPNHRKLDTLRNLVRDGYLSYQLGVKPLVNDILSVNTAIDKTYKNMSRNKRKLQERGKEKRKVVTTIDITDEVDNATPDSILDPDAIPGSWFEMSSTSTHTGKVRFDSDVVFDTRIFDYIHRDTAAVSSSLGLGNPAKIAWNATRLSFIADYFANVGTFVERLNVVPCFIIPNLQNETVGRWLDIRSAVYFHAYTNITHAVRGAGGNRIFGPNGLYIGEATLQDYARTPYLSNAGWSLQMKIPNIRQAATLAALVDGVASTVQKKLRLKNVHLPRLKRPISLDQQFK